MGCGTVGGGGAFYIFLNKPIFIKKWSPFVLLTTSYLLTGAASSRQTLPKFRRARNKLTATKNGRC